MNTQNETPDRQDINPANPDAKPYEPGYDWVAHGYDELDDNVEWEEHEGDYHVDGVLYCGHCHTPKQHAKPTASPSPAGARAKRWNGRNKKKKAAKPWKRPCGTGNWVFPTKF